MSEEEKIHAALWGENGIGGMYGMDCERAFRAGWKASAEAARAEAARLEELIRSWMTALEQTANRPEISKSTIMLVSTAMRTALAAGTAERGAEGT